jgi:hypothetical protein
MDASSSAQPHRLDDEYQHSHRSSVTAQARVDSDINQACEDGSECIVQDDGPQTPSTLSMQPNGAPTRDDPCQLPESKVTNAPPPGLSNFMERAMNARNKANATTTEEFSFMPAHPKNIGKFQLPRKAPVYMPLQQDTAAISEPGALESIELPKYK